MRSARHITSRRPACAKGRRAVGFTLVELMTACVIVSIALLGVYSIFQDAVQTERRLTRAWQDRQAAEAVVAQICRAVESATEMPGVAALKTGKESDGVPFLECLTYGDQQTLERRKYRWNVQSGVIDLRMIPYCGSQPVSVPKLETEDLWASVEPVTIGRRLGSLSIQFKTAVSKWTGQYAHSGSPAIVRVSASVGTATVERITACALTAAVLEGSP